MSSSTGRGNTRTHTHTVTFIHTACVPDFHFRLPLMKLDNWITIEWNEYSAALGNLHLQIHVHTHTHIRTHRYLNAITCTIMSDCNFTAVSRLFQGDPILEKDQRPRCRVLEYCSPTPSHPLQMNQTYVVSKHTHTQARTNTCAYILACIDKYFTAFCVLT